MFPYSAIVNGVKHARGIPVGMLWDISRASVAAFLFVGPSTDNVIFGIGLLYVMCPRNLFLLGRDTAEERDIDVKRPRKLEHELKGESKAPGGPLLIYYASQTGTAEGFAKTLRNQSKANGFHARVIDLEDFDAEELKASPAAVFLIATYGEGEATDNSVAFSKWLATPESDLPRDYLKGLKCAVFGLGNSGYTHYNSMSRYVDGGLAALGATRLMPRGEGDDDGSIEDDFNNWRDEMWPVFRKAFVPEPEGGGVGEGGMGGVGSASGWCEHPLPEFEFKAVTVEGERKHTPPGTSFDLTQVETSCRHYFTSVDVEVAEESRQLRQDSSSGSTLHLELDIRNTHTHNTHSHTSSMQKRLEYCTADNLAVLPVNSVETVDAAAATLGYDLDRWFELVPVDEGVQGGGDAESDASDDGDDDATTCATASKHLLLFPQPLAVREALSRYCDLTHAPRPPLLSHLSHFAADAKESARLQLLSSKEGKAEYEEWVVGQQRSLLEVLQAFPSLSLPLERFLELVPRLKPRYYTIASSPLSHPDRIHLTVSVIRSLKKGGGEGETQTQDQTQRRWLNGVCSSHLALLRPPSSPSASSAPPAPPCRDAHAHAHGHGLARVFVRPSSFRPPRDAATPIIMVGAGTGIAPMRALLQHRQVLRDQTKQQQQQQQQQQQHMAQQQPGMEDELGEAQVPEQQEQVPEQHEVQEHGDNILFFGCRSAEQDFLYRGELEGYEATGTLTQLHTAFSRQGNTKVYVQHRLAEQGALVWSLLDRGAHVYVCGATAMGQDVMKAVQDIIRKHKGVSEDEAAELVKELKTDGRYVQELWSA